MFPFHINFGWELSADSIFVCVFVSIDQLFVEYVFRY